EKCIDLLKIVKDIPVLVSAYNDDLDFKNNCYKSGAFDFITLLTSDSEFQARLVPALTVASIFEKNRIYKELLIKKNILDRNNDVFKDYDCLLIEQLENIKSKTLKATFGAISPNEKTKFHIHSNIMETVILNNLRKTDILMNFAPNKYFLILFDIDSNEAYNIWNKISNQIPQKLYAGFVNITNQTKEELINKALSELHFAINKDKNIAEIKNNPVLSLSNTQFTSSSYTNFKLFRQEFCKKIEQVITPVFYQIQQKYSNKLSGVTLNHGIGDGYGNFYIKNKNSNSSFKITSPGFSKINIDITYQKDNDNIDAKRITLEPEELEDGLLTDLLEQFIREYFENIK
ncbi:hypothetical protein IKB17_06945, partial [bacterium]|nr:hypothetical protein [bacterium]